jgi:hypothetical protein
MKRGMKCKFHRPIGASIVCVHVLLYEISKHACRIAITQYYWLIANYRLIADCARCQLLAYRQHAHSTNALPLVARARIQPIFMICFPLLFLVVVVRLFALIAFLVVMPTSRLTT